MGYKSHKAKVFAGSTIDLWLKFCKTLHVQVNPNDRIGHGQAGQIITRIPQLDARLLHPEFQFSYSLMDRYEAESWMSMLFITGHQQIYNLDRSRWEHIEDHIKSINSYIQTEEDIKGRDHDYEDDILTY